MRYYILLFFLALSFSQEVNYFHPEFPNEYVQFLQKTSNHSILNLNSKWDIFDTGKKTSLPFMFKNNASVVIKKKFFIAKGFKEGKNILSITGIRDNGIIRLNGQVIFSYKLNGMPVELELDPAKIYFGQENELEIEIHHHIDLLESIPRQALRNEAAYFGGIRDVYIRHEKKPHFANVSLQDENRYLSFQLKNFAIDSLRYFNYKYEISLISIKLDTLAHFVKQKRRLNQTTYNVKFRLHKNRKKLILPKNYYISITGLRWNKKKTEQLSPIQILRTKEDSTKKIHRFVAKVEQVRNGFPFETMKRMEDDVRLIKDAGFTGIYFPYEFPHPYYDYLAHIYQLDILSAYPFFSAPLSLMSIEKNKAYLNNFKLYNFSSIKLVYSDLLQNEFANEYNIKPVKLSSAVYEDYSGYLNLNNEEKQAKDLLEHLNNTDAIVISYFTDYFTENPSVQQKENGNSFLSTKGLMTIDRKEKKAFRIAKSFFHSEQTQLVNPGTKIIRENYVFIIFGLITFSIFVIGFKQATRLSGNLKRSFFHAHGFFTDTRDRRVLYMGQSSFLAFLTLFTLSNIGAAFLFFNRKDEILASSINYLFDDSGQEFFVNLFSNPVSTQILMVFFFLLFLFLILFTLKIISFFGKRSASLKQILTVFIWASNPMLFLIPVSLFLYNALISQFYTSTILYSVLLCLVWSLLRILNGVRVIVDCSRSRVYSIFLILLLFGFAFTWFLLEYYYAFSDYMMYFVQLIQV